MPALVLENGTVRVKNGGNVLLDNITVTVSRYKGKNCVMQPTAAAGSTVKLRYDDADNSKMSFEGELTGDIENGVLIVRFCTTLNHDHTCMPVTFAGDDSAVIAFDSVSADGIMANYQSSPWWTRPAFAHSTGELPDKTLSVLMDMGGEYVHMYPMCDGNYRTCIKGEGARTELKASIRCTGYSAMSGVMLAVGIGSDPYLTVHNTMAAGLQSVREPVPMKEGRSDIDALGLLGWCTYDAFYREVTHDKIITKLKEFKQKNIPVRMLLIDSGWFVHNEGGTVGQKATDLRANPDKFPNGLKGLIDEVKRDYGIEKVGIWHGLSVIWQGIEKGSYAYEQTKDWLTELNSGLCFPSFDRQKAFGFYNYWHSYLKSEGIDFIKVDLQAEMPIMAENVVNINDAMKGLHAGFEASAALHFGGDVINCMGMAQENVQSRPLSGVARNSDDFFPKKENGFSEHFLQNGYNSVYHGQIYFCDFDMWWTQHESAHQSAILRAVSGGPVYVSDPIGCTDGDELMRMCNGSGVLYRCDNNGVICRDNLFSSPATDGTVAKMFNMCADSGLVAAFNTDSEGRTVTGHIKAADVEGIDGEKFLCYMHNSKTLKTVSLNEHINLTLNKNEGELAVFVPVCDGFAALGLTDKYVCPATVIESGKNFALLTEGGNFAFYSADRVTSVTANGETVPYNSVGGGIYTAQIPMFDNGIAVEIQ